MSIGVEKMTHHERLSTVACHSCGTVLPRDRLTSLEVDHLQTKLDGMLALLGELKPMLITASYYLDQHAHLLHAAIVPGSEDAGQQSVREAHVRRICSELMEAYCRSAELVARR
jgi:hypothetical protein